MEFSNESLLSNLETPFLVLLSLWQVRIDLVNPAEEKVSVESCFLTEIICCVPQHVGKVGYPKSILWFIMKNTVILGYSKKKSETPMHETIAPMTLRAVIG